MSSYEQRFSAEISSSVPSVGSPSKKPRKDKEDDEKKEAPPPEDEDGAASEDDDVNDQDDVDDGYETMLSLVGTNRKDLLALLNTASGLALLASSHQNFLRQAARRIAPVINIKSTDPSCIH